jgi:hypothetical protein
MLDTGYSILDSGLVAGISYRILRDLTRTLKVRAKTVFCLLNSVFCLYVLFCADFIISRSFLADVMDASFFEPKDSYVGKLCWG